jgi:hypothetical protein
MALCDITYRLQWARRTLGRGTRLPRSLWDCRSLPQRCRSPHNPHAQQTNRLLRSGCWWVAPWEDVPETFTESSRYSRSARPQQPQQQLSSINTGPCHKLASSHAEFAIWQRLNCRRMSIKPHAPSFCCCPLPVLYPCFRRCFSD